MTQKENWRRVVAEIKAVATATGRRRLGRCSLEGTRLFERALAAEVPIEQATVLESFMRDAGSRAQVLREGLLTSGCELFIIPDDVMASLTDGRSIGSLVGLARLPESRTLPEVLAAAPTEPPLLLACVESNDPANVGALVRTAHASGVAALLAVGGTDPFHPRAVRTSMGSVFRLPVLAYYNFGALLDALRVAGVRSIGAVASGGQSLPSWERSERATAVVLGSEAFGLSAEHCAALDGLVTIPMAAGVDSYSLNAAAAVVLYEFQNPRC